MMDNHSKNNEQKQEESNKTNLSLEKKIWTLLYSLGFIHIVNFITLTLLPIMEIKELKNNL
jgi:hypothetical protein